MILKHKYLSYGTMQNMFHTYSPVLFNTKAINCKEAEVLKSKINHARL